MKMPKVTVNADILKNFEAILNNRPKNKANQIIKACMNVLKIGVNNYQAGKINPSNRQIHKAQALWNSLSCAGSQKIETLDNYLEHGEKALGVASIQTSPSEKRNSLSHKMALAISEQLLTPNNNRYNAFENIIEITPLQLLKRLTNAIKNSPYLRDELLSQSDKLLKERNCQNCASMREKLQNSLSCICESELESDCQTNSPNTH